MPFLKIQTNREIDAGKTNDLLQVMTEIVVQDLGKPREYVQVMLEAGKALAFAGTTDPSAFVELRSLGMPEGKPQEVSRAICDLLQEDLGIPPDRVFINFFDMARSMWGWNGDTFG